VAKLRITWTKSAIGYAHDQKETIRNLGLKRLGHSIEQNDTASVRGMIHKVRHLVVVEEVPSS
jgi:large subunit ribosomal protein L30